MKNILKILLILSVMSCSTTRFSDSWINPEYVNYQPSKVLILGITPDLTARKLYEEKLSSVLEKRGIDASESLEVFKPSFTDLKQSEIEIDAQIVSLSKEDFDAIIISTVKGYDEMVFYNNDMFRGDYNLRRFEPYYYNYQDVYFNNRIYEEYKVYHIEILLYDLTRNTEKSLVWVASYDIIDPQRINSAIKDCVVEIVKSLENEKIIPLK